MRSDYKLYAEYFFSRHNRRFLHIQGYKQSIKSIASFGKRNAKLFPSHFRFIT